MAGHRIRIVDSFDALISTRFEGDINALCWRRRLTGDFREVVDQLAAAGAAGGVAARGITTIDDDDLRVLRLSPEGAIARAVLLADQAMLRRHGLAPSLDLIFGYPKDAGDEPISTEVYSFHVDSAPVEADTYLCTYIGCSSEGISNEAAVRRVDVAETRAELLDIHGGPDDDAFAAYLSEHSFDLHYWPKPDAQPFTFGLGDVWRIAVAYPGAPVLPCIHRAPLTLPGSAARLLLIS